MCADREIDTTVYYSGRTEYWQRVVVPLNGLQICGYVMTSVIAVEVYCSKFHPQLI